jgi:glutamyl-tRNA reductase
MRSKRVLADLFIIHSFLGSVDEPAAAPTLLWQTCLRRIVFLQPAETNFFVAGLCANSALYYGEDAYRFLLEVICGLHSPLVGETEVMGQFREFCAETRFPVTRWGWSLHRIILDLLADAKSVRQHHLQGLGSQSYGSLVRRHSKGTENIAVLGAGQLAQHILPWLADKNQVNLFYRRELRVETLRRRFPQVRLCQFAIEDASWDDGEEALVIAAPLPAAEIETWTRLQSVSFSVCLDLRGDSETDPVSLSLPVTKLSELFSELREDRQHREDCVSAARAEIEQIVHVRRGTNNQGYYRNAYAPDHSIAPQRVDMLRSV